MAQPIQNGEAPIHPKNKTTANRTCNAGDQGEARRGDAVPAVAIGAQALPPARQDPGLRSSPPGMRRVRGPTQRGLGFVLVEWRLPAALCVIVWSCGRDVVWSRGLADSGNSRPTWIGRRSDCLATTGALLCPGECHLAGTQRGVAASPQRRRRRRRQ